MEEHNITCHTVSFTRIVAGLSQYVLLVAPPNSPVSASHVSTPLDITITATLSSFRYSSAVMLMLNRPSHARPIIPMVNPSNVANRIRSLPHE